MNIFNNILFEESLLNIMHITSGPCLDNAMVFITYAGGTFPCLAVVSVLYIYCKREKSAKIAAVFILSMLVNALLKMLFNHPRPDQSLLLPEIAKLYSIYSPHSPGFPSGHTQGITVLWLSIFYYFRKKYLIIPVLFLIILVPFSRIYLGVHFAGDVVGGYIIAFAVLITAIPAVNFVENIWSRYIKMALIPVMTVAPPVVSYFFQIQNIYMLSGFSSGFITGILISDMKKNTDENPGLMKKNMLALSGISGVVIITLFFRFFNVHSPAFKYFQFWMTGIWITLIVPFFLSLIKSKKTPAKNF